MASELSAEAQKIVDDGRNWDADTVQALRDRVRLGFRLMYLFLVLFVLAAVCGLGVWAKMAAPVLPGMIAINTLEGGAQYIDVFDTRKISAIEAVHRNWAKQYVERCERYIPAMINDDFAACAEMSEGEALSKYSAIFQGEDARHKKLLNSQTWTIDVINVQLPPDAKGVSVVRFKKTIWRNGNAAAVGYFTARLAYRFADNPTGNARQKDSNPLNYKVRSYVADVDTNTAPTVNAQPMAPANN